MFLSALQWRVLTEVIEQSSQWDGLRHFSMPREEGSQERVFYGGTTKEEILDRSNDRIGIHHWAQQGITGIVNVLQKSNFKLMLANALQRRTRGPHRLRIMG